MSYKIKELWDEKKRFYNGRVNFCNYYIGILAATALPKFAGVREKAKINSELAALSGLDGSIIAEKEFRIEDFGDDNISWHNSDLADRTDTATNQATQYAKINNSKKVLSKIAKKTGNLKIIGLALSDGNDMIATNTASGYYKNSVLVIVGPASNPDSGVSQNTELPNSE